MPIRFPIVGWFSGRRIGMPLLAAMVSACATVPAPETVPPPSPSSVIAPADETPAVVAVPSAAPPPESPVPVPLSPAPGARPARVLGTEDFIERNDENMLRIYVGMSRAAVDRIMGSYRTGVLANPHKRQLITGAGGKVHEVLFYLTRKPRAGQRITENALTPVVVADDRVTAIGRYPLKKLRRAACQARGETPCP